MTRPTDMWSDTPTPCAKCGQPHATRTGTPSCAGHKRDGSPCTEYPMHGQRVGRMHGGKAPKAMAAAERRMQEAAALAAAVTYGLSRDISPTDALLEEVRWTAGHVQWLRARVQELEKASLVWGTTKTESETAGGLGITFGGADADDEIGLIDVGSVPASKVIQSAGPSVWLDLYERERKHLVAVCAAAIKAGVEERRVRLAESQGELVAGAIRAILADLGLNAAQQALVSEVVPRHLRLLAGGAA